METKKLLSTNKNIEDEMIWSSSKYKNHWDLKFTDILLFLRVLESCQFIVSMYSIGLHTVTRQTAADVQIFSLCLSNGQEYTALKTQGTCSRW